MVLVEPGTEILYPRSQEEWLRELRLIELAGRTAYKSEDKITDDSYKSFIETIIKRGHEAVIEFGSMMVHFVTDRGITHEIVRHRLCSFLQESTRYCDYNNAKFDGECSFIKPAAILHTDDQRAINSWIKACEKAESEYRNLRGYDFSPQIARAVLPNCLKTEIMVKANFREWRHIFQLRAISKAAHPDMRNLMIPLYNNLRDLCPLIFEMGDVE